MKFKSGVVLTEQGSNTIIVATGSAGKAFSGMIKLNSSAAFIARQLMNDTDEASVVASLLEKYEITPEHAAESVKAVTAKLDGVGLLEK